MSVCTALVLDMDGVLFDLPLKTEEVRQRIRSEFAKHGIEESFSPLYLPLQRRLEEMKQKDPAKAAALAEFAWGLVREEEIRAAGVAPFHPGAEKLLEDTKDLPLAIFTNNHIDSALRAFEVHGIPRERFFSIQARRGPGSIKPSGEPLIQILSDAPSTIERLFFVGDAPVDMESALRAQKLYKGSAAIVPVGLYDRSRFSDLENAGAWLLAASHAEVATLVRQEKTAHTLSLVYLAYNEEADIGKAIEDARRFGKLYLKKCEAVIVDDGSHDRTAEVAREMNEGDVLVVRHEKNMGMGASMRDGYLAATQEYIAHLPGDRQVRAQSLACFLPRFSPTTVPLSTYENPPSGFKRDILSFLFRGVVRFVGGMRVNFAGTYVFHRDWRGKVDLPTVKSNTFVFSFELLERLRKLGAKFAPVRIRTFPRVTGGSREVTLRRIGGVFREILKQRLA